MICFLCVPKQSFLLGHQKKYIAWLWLISSTHCISSVCLQDVEANTVRLKEHEEDVLVLERSNNRSSSSSPLKYIYLLLSMLTLGIYGKTMICYISTTSNYMSNPDLWPVLQVHCDVRNSREDSGTSSGDSETWFPVHRARYFTVHSEKYMPLNRETISNNSL